MTVVCRPDLSTLARIVSILHARRVSLIGLRYAAGQDVAGLECDVRSDDASLVAAQVRRAVGVLSADVTRPAVVAVAS
jgi:hypothetical protein